jgi:hypothetical protein
LLNVGRDRDRVSARRLDLACQFLELAGASRDQRNRVSAGESPRQRRAQARADANHHGNGFFRLSHRF